MTAKKGFLPDEPWNEKCERGEDRQYTVGWVWSIRKPSVSHKIPPIDLSVDEQHIFDKYNYADRNFHGNALKFMIRTEHTSRHRVRVNENTIECSDGKKCLIAYP